MYLLHYEVKSIFQHMIDAEIIQGAKQFPEGTGPIFLGWLKCGEDDDNSRRLIDCPRRNEPLLFRHNHDSGVKCIPGKW